FRELGATFIKVGQIMSTRPDLLPSEIVGELVQLQENVRPFPVAEVKRIVEEDLRRPLNDLFDDFDKRPLASASVAQVHRARLKGTGEALAIKVRRPSIARWAELDRSIILGIAHALELIPSMRMVSPVESARQFCDAINRQLDFRREAANNRRFRENFAGETYVVFPRVYENLSSERVLTMEFVEGYRDSELASVGIDPKKVAGLGMRTFCKMTFIDGFIHADLHPGNIRFMRDHRLALFDLGLTAELTDEDRLMFAQTMFYMANGMGPQLAKQMYDLTEHRIEIDYAAYEREISEYLARFVNQPLGEIEMSVAIGKFFDIYRRYGMRLDGRYTVLNVSMMVCEGLGKKLDPSLDITTEAKPFLAAALAPLMKQSSATA
ncbi:MAG TPA: AarF/UbiB family protein, partial [Candidatus Binataceae bacterium]|nr:AarF/UbiB family protein [Candidatus Binataceae bacterium]